MVACESEDPSFKPSVSMIEQLHGEVPTSPAGAGAPTDATPAMEGGADTVSEAAQPSELANTAAAVDPDAAMAREWMNQIYDRVRLDKIGPPVASRIYAYTALALFEGAVPGSDELVSLGGQLNDMPTMPAPAGTVDVWPAVSVAAVHTVATGLFPSEDSDAAFATLYDLQLADLQAQERGDMRASTAYGEQIGAQLLAWADDDGFAATRAMTYTTPTGDGLWVATNPDQPNPSEPYWGTLRPFALATGHACKPAPALEYSLDEDSDFWNEVQEVYQSSEASEEQRAIAYFWADGPGETGTPPGHWVAIVGQLVESERLGFEDAVEAYALTGIALADAFIGCWAEKYESNVIRPVTVIQANLDEAWAPIINTPPFPEYPSGHSTASAAAATVLTELFGESAFLDSTHTSMGLPPRHFASFRAAAEEAAMSRLYGGIHFRHAIEEGLRQGDCVGERVLEVAKTRRLSP
jgi:hypothetical protein